MPTTHILFDFFGTLVAYDSANAVTVYPKTRELLSRWGVTLTNEEMLSRWSEHWMGFEVRSQVDTWRNLPASQWQVTPETGRLLQHWRHHEFGGVRPFFCQIEAIETAIWFTEVAPHLASGKRLIENFKIRGLGSSTLHLAYAAVGLLDGVVEHNNKIWDIAAAAALIDEAGSELHYFSNPPFPLREFTLKAPRVQYVAGNKDVSSKLREILGR